MPDTDILLGGYGLFGGRGEYTAKIKVNTRYRMLEFQEITRKDNKRSIIKNHCSFSTLQ